MGDYKIKPWEELTIRDDYMFKLVMRAGAFARRCLKEHFA